MGAPPYNRSPQLSRASLVLGFYGSMAGVALLISAGRGDMDLYRIEGTSTPMNMWVWSPLIGLAVAVAVVLASRLAVTRFEWARMLHRWFRSILGPLSHREILVIALASAVGEELLFRGALQPWLGLWPAAATFALVHIGPGFRYWPWTAVALGLGVGLGYMYQRTGDLSGPIVAHFVINYLNLGFIRRHAIPEPASRKRSFTPRPRTAPAAEPSNEVEAA
jgi:hypothetical protein